MLTGDGTYASVRLVSRLRLDSALYNSPAPQPPSKRGPKLRKGRWQPGLVTRLADPATAWQRQALPWYGCQEKVLDLITGTAWWHRQGEPPLPSRWVFLHCPAQIIPPTALFCTDQATKPRQLVAWFVGWGNIEVTLQCAPISGSRPNASRRRGRWAETTPCLLSLSSLVFLLAQTLHPQWLSARHAAWYPKAEATFADALAAVRRRLRSRGNYDESAGTPDTTLILRPLWESLHEVVCYAD